MGFVKRTLSMFLLITFPVKFVIWTLAILCLFCIIAIKGMIINDDFYHKTLLQHELERINDEFLTNQCKSKNFEACILSSSVFARDGKTLITSYSKIFGDGGKNQKEPSEIKIKGSMEVSSLKGQQGNLEILKGLKKGCVQLHESTGALLDYINIKDNLPKDSKNIEFDWAYVCFKKGIYYSLFTKGKACETCSVELNSHFNAGSYSMFYGYKNGFFDRVARFTFDFTTTFVSQRLSGFKAWVRHTVISITKYITNKLPNEDTEPSVKESGQNFDNAKPKTDEGSNLNSNQRPSFKEDVESTYEDSLPPENN